MNWCSDKSNYLQLAKISGGLVQPVSQEINVRHPTDLSGWGGGEGVLDLPGGIRGCWTLTGCREARLYRRFSGGQLPCVAAAHTLLLTLVRLAPPLSATPYAPYSTPLFPTLPCPSSLLIPPRFALLAA